MNKCTKLLNELEISIKKREETKGIIYINRSMILKLANKIKEAYKDYIDVISSGILPSSKYFYFKTNDEDIGFCGTLELAVGNAFVIGRICFTPQHEISFYEDTIYIDCLPLDEESRRTLQVDEITKIIKTLNFALENKQMIFESLEKYISETLNDKITKCSNETNILEENLNFIKSIKL